MSQSKADSMKEAMTNIAVGYSINCVANLCILPLFGYVVTLSDSLLIGVAFTGVSLVRQYVIRRWFNKKQVEGIHG
jgi:hypothetical protein